jgi:hypothetical protein
LSKSAENRLPEMAVVYRAAGETEAHIVQGMLECHDIPSLLSSDAAPSVHVFLVDGMGEVRVMVPAAVADRAIELIEGDGNV